MSIYSFHFIARVKGGLTEVHHIYIVYWYTRGGFFTRSQKVVTVGWGGREMRRMRVKAG